MNTPFNLNQLRASIGGDLAVEQALVVFIDSLQQSLSMLNILFPLAENEEYNQLWRNHMHLIRSAALQIRAEKLVMLAGVAHNFGNAPLKEKRQMLVFLAAEFAVIERFIDSNCLNFLQVG